MLLRAKGLHIWEDVDYAGIAGEHDAAFLARIFGEGRVPHNHGDYSATSSQLRSSATLATSFES